MRDRCPRPCHSRIGWRRRSDHKKSVRSDASPTPAVSVVGRRTSMRTTEGAGRRRVECRNRHRRGTRHPNRRQMSDRAVRAVPGNRPTPKALLAESGMPVTQRRLRHASNVDFDFGPSWSHSSLLILGASIGPAQPRLARLFHSIVSIGVNRPWPRIRTLVASRIVLPSRRSDRFGRLCGRLRQPSPDQDGQILVRKTSVRCSYRFSGRFLRLTPET